MKLRRVKKQVASLGQGTERAGHIPGAVHIEHELTLNEDGTFKSINELQALYRGKGITADKEVFPYCAINTCEVLLPNVPIEQ